MREPLKPKLLSSRIQASLQRTTVPERHAQEHQRLRRDLAQHTVRPLAVQRQAIHPVMRAAALERAETERLQQTREALQRQITQTPASGASEGNSLQRQQAALTAHVQARAPRSPSDWVTIMRSRAEQVAGRKLNARDTEQFRSLQRQVAQTLAQGFRQDRQAPEARYAQYADHLVALQRHPISAPVSRVVLDLIPGSERPHLQRAVDEALRRDQLQRMQDDALVADQAVQRQMAELEAEAARPVFERIQARRGSGNPLPAAVQRHLEQGLNHDLSAVRIHDDAEADKLAKGVNATAFTTGADIYFQSGKFNPNTRSGLELLAHEVTHTVQQSQGKVGKGIDPDAGLEAEARSMGAKLATSQARRQRVKPTASLTPQRSTVIQRKGTSAATPAAYVTAFKAKLRQAALTVLAQNEQRLLERQKALKDTSPTNEAWVSLHQVARLNAQVEGAWSTLSQGIIKEVTALSGSTAASAFGNAALSLRLSDQRDSLLQSAYIGWSRTHPQPGGLVMPTPASSQQYQAQFAAAVAPVKGMFTRIARVEDARDYLRAQYPDVAMLGRKLGAAALGNTANTKQQNAQLYGQLTAEYAKVRAAMSKLRAKLQAGELPIPQMDVLVQQVLQKEGIKAGAMDAKAQAINGWLTESRNTNFWTDIGLALAALGFTIGAVLAPEFVLPVAGAMLAGGTLTVRNYLSAESQVTVSNTQALGGRGLTSVSPETAKFQMVMAQVDALLAGAGLVSAVGAGMRSLGPLTRETTELARSGGYRWSTAGEVNTGSPVRRRVNTPAVVPDDLKPLPKSNGRVPAPAASIQGIERQVLLARYCDNWSAVQPFIRQKAARNNLPPGYLYLETKLSNGKVTKMAYQPKSKQGSVPKLKADGSGNWQPDGLLYKDGKLVADYRIVQKSEYDRTNPPPMQGANLTQNHHLWPDNFMRSNSFFQEGFARGLIPPDRATNMLTLANSPAALAKLRAKFPNITFNDVMHATSHPAYDDLVGLWFRREYPNLLKEVGAKTGTLAKDLTDNQIIKMTQRFDEIIRGKFTSPPQELLDILRGGFLTKNISGDQVYGA